MATAKGGNCELSVENKIIEHKGITLIGYSNMAGFIPATASELYANNLVNLMPSITTSPLSLHFNKDDEIIKQALLCHEGESYNMAEINTLSNPYIAILTIFILACL